MLFNLFFFFSQGMITFVLLKFEIVNLVKPWLSESNSF